MIVDIIINPAVLPDIVAVTFGAFANALENVTVNEPELVVPEPYKYLVTLIDDKVVFIDDIFTASVSIPAFKVFGTLEAQVMEVEGK